MNTLNPTIPSMSAAHDSMLAQAILTACCEARTQHTSHVHCCDVDVTAVDLGLQCFIALKHRDWRAEGMVQAIDIG